MNTFLNAFKDSLESDFSTQSIYLFIYLFIYWQYLTRLAKLSYNLVQIGHWKVLLNFSRISDVKMPKNYVVFLVEHFWIYFIGYNI